MELLRKYEVWWGAGYPPTPSEIHRRGWFNYDKGFDSYEQDEIDILEVGDVARLGAPWAETFVRRLT